MVRVLGAIFLLYAGMSVAAQTCANIEQDIASLQKTLAQLYQDLHLAQAELHIDPGNIKKNVRVQHAQAYINAYEEKISEKRGALALHSIGQPPIAPPKITQIPTKKQQVQQPKVKVIPTHRPVPSTQPKSTPALQMTKDTPCSSEKPVKKELKKKAHTQPATIARKPSSAQKKPVPTKKPGLYSHEIVKGSILKPYGKIGKLLPDPMHQKSGIVFSCSPKATVYAPTTAEVVLVEKVYGRMACILKHHTDHYTAIYGIEYILISENDTVQGGQPIGRLSDSPALLYVELRQNDAAKDISQHLT